MPRIIGQNRIARVNIGNRPITYRPAAGARATLTFPMQPETLAYLASLDSPSSVFINAVNTLFYHMKRLNLYTSLHAGWIHCTDNAGGNLLEIKGTAGRTATNNGALTFTPRKGYSGFNASKWLAWPTGNFTATNSRPSYLFGVITLGNGGSGPAGNMAAIDQNARAETGQLPLTYFNAGAAPGFVIGAANNAQGNRAAPLAGGAGYTEMVAGGSGIGSAGPQDWGPVGLATGNLYVDLLLAQVSCLFIWPQTTGHPPIIREFSLYLTNFLYEVGAFP